MNLNQITLPVTDVERSSYFYRRLALRQIVRAPHYARFECPQGDATFSLHRTAPPLQPSQMVLYFEIEALDAEVQRLQAAGFEFTQLPRDEPWLWREARLPDPDGHPLCLYRAGANRRHPPWRLPD